MIVSTMHRYEFRVGLPHTNYNQLSEPLLMMQAGYYQWASIAKQAGTKLNDMRATTGTRVYATFYYIETEFPEATPISSFELDTDIVAVNRLRAFKNVAVEGQLLFDRADALDADAIARRDGTLDGLRGTHPYIRMANVFVNPEAGNDRLKVAPPCNADFSTFEPLPNDANPYHIVRDASERGLGCFADAVWSDVTRDKAFSVRYEIDPDRDSNGAGLVYFANYFAFMEFAERKAMGLNSRRPFTPAEINGRTVRSRRTAYYGNADLQDALRIEVDILQHAHSPRLVGFRYRIHRASDDVIVCLSEATKVLPA